MKKILKMLEITFLALVILFSIVACGESGDPKAPPNNEPPRQPSSAPIPPDNDPSPGKYRFSLFATVDVHYILVTNRAKTQVIEAYTAMCMRPQSSAWGIDYEPDISGSFAKTADGNFLEIPAIVLSQLPDPPATQGTGGDTVRPPGSGGTEGTSAEA